MLARPIRVRIVEVLNQRDMSAQEFCREGLAPPDVDAAEIAEHFRELTAHGWLELADYDPRHGTVERVHSGCGRAYFAEAHWNELDRAEREALSRTMVQGLMARVEDALRGESFDARTSRHLTWIAMRLDEQGWSEMTTALDAAFGEIEQIRSDAEARLQRRGEEGIPSTCGILGFPSPDDALRVPPPVD
ncbi:MAG TPA: hypothetical protein VHZ54_16390 [Solirubrobacterales bacterium]|nr:hypothetical protein [Solirubrobacterales bacterium]